MSRMVFECLWCLFVFCDVVFFAEEMPDLRKAAEAGSASRRCVGVHVYLVYLS